MSVSGLSKRYGTVQAVDDVSFEVAHGEVFALLGPNGAGKTTTVELLEGFGRPDAGRIEVLGFDPAARTTSRQLRERLGIVLQELSVEPFLTVRQVLQRNAGYYRSPRPVAEVIELIGLADKADTRVKRLSGGQLRRLDLGVGVVGRPQLLFLDEPTTGFDPSARRDFWALVRSLGAEGTTVLLTTHYMEEAEALADRVAVMKSGRIVAQGLPTSLAGRDLAEARIRFRLPPGTAPATLPLQLSSLDGDVCEIRTSTEITVLRLLTTWSAERNVDISGLTVDRLTLEDVYLTLTGGRPGTPSQTEADR
ncbi:MAG TPA: ABC transporter ATP-binding protein [Candidatus Micrarchaeia archaeon]|nr:ABC transporter ATP-binding protein [Candidatus Micrarchaeia archaeon]